MQPADQPDATRGQTSLHLVNAIWASGRDLVVRSVSQGPTLGPPRLVRVAPYDLPADAPQPGGNPIDTFDTRLLGASHRYGAIYTAHTTSMTT